MLVKSILNFFLVTVTLLFSCSWAIDAVPSENTNLFDDWIDAPEQNKICHGFYQQLPILFPGKSKEFLSKQPLTITSDQGEFTNEGNSIFQGHVHLIQGNRQIFANKAIIHRDPNKQKPIDRIQAKSNVKITEPGLRIDGTSAELLVEEDQQVVDDAHYRLYDRHARGEAKQITIYQKTKMVLNKATYTTCNPHQNTWKLSAKQVDLNKKTGRGQARDARLYVKDIPIFYIPYMDFPIDDRRQTGFLYPSFGMTNRSGAEFSVPFYWNMAPNYDLTLTPRVLSKRGLEFQGHYRYLTRHSQGELEGSFLPNDRAYRQFRQTRISNHPKMANLDPRITALNTHNNRQALRYKQDLQLNTYSTAQLQYHTVGDDNYFMDFGDNIGIASTTQLLQQVDVNHASPYWLMQAKLQQYQTLHPFDGPVTQNVYRRLPQISLQNNVDLPLGSLWTMNSDYTHFLHKQDPLTGATFTTGDRLQLRPSLSLPLYRPSGYIRPRIQWNMLFYALTVGANNVNPQRSNPKLMLPIFDVDTGLFFERNLTVRKNAFIQTLEPRAYYLAVPFRNQNGLPNFDTGYPGFSYNQLFWDNRFTGLDRIGDANQLTLSITSRFFPENTGIERLSLTLGQINYFKKYSVTSCSQTSHSCIDQELPNRLRRHSSWVGMARYLIQEFWSANINAEWDPYKNKIDKNAFSIQYHPDELSVLNLGYQYLRKNPVGPDPITGKSIPLNQTDTSLAWPVTEQWRLLGRWHFDLHRHRSNDISFGIEQQGCCTAVRLFVSHFLRPYDVNQTNVKKYANAVYIQFVFKGLAGVGDNSMQHELKRAIPNYTQWSVDKF
jgi:LPS-assembly protein